MKVKELIERLQQFNSEFEVITEGCDCYGDTHDVELYGGTNKKLVLIKRGEDTNMIELLTKNNP